jgi:protocatechuate 3,4-dioxygenase beta subunit
MDGVPLLLDVGVMDVTTCTPLEDALVDVCELEMKLDIC